MHLRRALAIINPAAGSQFGPDVAQWLIDLAVGRGIELVIRETMPDAGPRDLAGDARAFDRLIASGGDGTLMHVMSSLAHSDVPIAIIPSGTGNVLAKALGVPLDLRAACHAALSPARLLAMDLGVVNDSFYFALRMSAGYEALVIRDTTREMKLSLGRLAYAVQGSKHALHVQPARYRIEIDGDVIERETINLWIANSGTLGVMGLDLDPRIRMDDGHLDLCALSLGSISGAPAAVAQLMKQGELPQAVLNHVPVRHHARIEAWPPQPIQADGDLIGETPCAVSVAPRAIQVCVPNLDEAH
jgi:diacylglycerol kinase family enzyme